MAKIKPFKGVRPAEDKVREVASPPYDVMNSAEARVMAKDNPMSFLHVVKPEIDLPEDINIYDEKVYQKGHDNLYNMIKENVLIQDNKDCYYLYKQVMGDHSQIGLVAGASIEDYENDVIKKHEHTRANKEVDRIKHVDTLNANTGPVFLTYKAVEEIDTLVARITAEKPVYDFTSDDGIQHVFWVVDADEDINEISRLFGAIDVLYVADGHHRSASGTKVGQKRREANANHTGDEEYNFFLSVIFPDNQMYIMDYNRVVKDLNNHTNEEYLELISEKFEVKEVGNGFSPTEMHTFGMYFNGQWYKLTAKDGTFPESDPVKSLDVSILQENLLTPVLAIGNPRTDERIDFVGGIRGLGELEKRVNHGEAVAFSMCPTSIKQLMDIADAGEVMPPKSTWFEPKLRSGVIVHLLD